MARHDERMTMEPPATVTHRGRSGTAPKHKPDSHREAAPDDAPSKRAAEGTGEEHRGHGTVSTTKDRLYLGKGGQQGGGSQLKQEGWPPDMAGMRSQHEHNPTFEGVAAKGSGDQGRGGREAQPVPSRPLKQKPTDGGQYYYPQQKGR